MKYKILIRKKTERTLYKLPLKIQQKLKVLILWLGENGPYAYHFPNYSKLGANNFHCHLGYSWVACWKFDRKAVIIEVYYVGSRENSPY